MSLPDAHALPDAPCCLNGESSTLKNAKVSVLDRGFIFGDGIYEVVFADGGRLFRFGQHMVRLERSLAALRIANPLEHSRWRDIAHKSIADYAHPASIEAINGNQLIYLQITRGVALRDHAMPAGVTPTVFVMLTPLKLPDEEQRRLGVACVTADDFRWEKAHIKTTSLLGAVLARQISVDAGALETVMFRGDFLSEAAASNVWIVKNGAVTGPPKDNLVLEGIRYGLIEEFCRTAVIGHQGNFARHRAGRPASRLRQAWPRLCQTARRLPPSHTGTLVMSTPPPNIPQNPPEAPARQDSLIEYPSLFPIKVMGVKAEGYVHAVTQIARQFDPAFDASTIELRESKGGNYLGVTITVTATSREQLDELYRTLSTHPMVKVVL